MSIIQTMSENEIEMGSESPTPRTIRATVVQASTVFYDTPATFDKAERLIAEGAAYGSQLLVFPEAFIGGYPRGSNFGVIIGNRSLKGREEFRKYHVSAILTLPYAFSCMGWTLGIVSLSVAASSWWWRRSKRGNL